MDDNQNTMNPDFGFSNDLVTPEDTTGNASIDLNTLTDEDQPVVPAAPEEKPAAYDLNNLGEGFDTPAAEAPAEEEHSAEAPSQVDPLETPTEPESDPAAPVMEPVATNPSPMPKVEVLTAPARKSNPTVLILILVGCAALLVGGFFLIRAIL